MWLPLLTGMLTGLGLGSKGDLKGLLANVELEKDIKQSYTSVKYNYDLYAPQLSYDYNYSPTLVIGSPEANITGTNLTKKEMQQTAPQTPFIMPLQLQPNLTKEEDNGLNIERAIILTGLGIIAYKIIEKYL